MKKNRKMRQHFPVYQIKPNSQDLKKSGTLCLTFNLCKFMKNKPNYDTPFSKKGVIKILQIMKLTLFLIFLTVFQLSANSVFPQGKNISLDMQNVTVRDIIMEIETQGEMNFFYNDDLTELDRQISVSYQEKPIQEVLENALAQAGMTYEIIRDNFVVLIPERINAQQEKIDVNGQVTDNEGNPLPGVNIIIKGSTSGVITNLDGEYNLKVDDQNTVLVFSYVGYQSQEISVGDQSVINVSLQVDAVGLEEVVVIGYGTSSAKKLTTSIATLKEEQIAAQPITNIADAFTGNVSGIMVEQGSGAPGDAPIIRVRGYGSINAGSEPLYVIDGMIVTADDFNRLNPKSVESVNILKDAAAGAIYGSRAGNGVIIVTTKRGSGKPNFSFNATIGLQQVEKKIDVLSGPEFIQYSKDAYAATGGEVPTFSPDVGNTNWQDEIFRTGLYQNYQLSANGGNENLKYNVSLNYLGDEGILITTFENNYSSNGNFDIKLSDKLNLGLTYNASYIKGRSNPKLGGPGHGSGGIMEDAIVEYPVIPVYLPNGDYGQQQSNNWGSPVVYGGYGNPVAGLQEVYDKRSGFSGLGRTFLNYEPVYGLNINVSFSGIIDTRYRDYHESPYLAANGHSRDANFSNPRYDNIVALQENNLRSGYTTDAFVNYQRTLSNEHNFGIVAGLSYEYRGYRATSAQATENDRGANAENPLPRFDNYLRPNIFGANDIRGGGGFWEETFNSLFARLNYDYKDKYLFMASVRRDGSSKFAPDNRFGTFPAVSAAWRITEESFMDAQNLFNELKLRLSYGISGNDQIGNYQWQGRVNYGEQYIYGPSEFSEGSVTVAYPSSIENPNLNGKPTNKSMRELI